MAYTVVAFIVMAITLRTMALQLDSTQGYQQPPELQLKTARQSFRFLDSQMHYQEEDVTVLIRALEHNKPADRIVFYNEVRSCRRRVQRDWRKIGVAPVLRVVDQFHLLELRAVIAAVKMRVQAKGMKLFDAFRAFDYDRDGMLNCSELFGGLLWLGMKVGQEDIYAVMKHIDKKGDGRIRYNDFLLTFRGSELEEEEDETSDAAQMETSAKDEFERVVVEPRYMKELYDIDEASTAKPIGAITNMP